MKSSEIFMLFFTFVVWYAFNAGYNVYNSFVKVDYPLPLAIASVQLAIGLLYAIPLWLLGMRTMPKLSFSDFTMLLPIATLNTFGHCCAVFAMFQKGGGSFTHVIKASEPVVSVLFDIMINGAFPKPFTCLSLLPICYGVAYASTLGNLNAEVMARELTTPAAIMAMGSNLSFALRSILKKKLPSDFTVRTNLDSTNEHAVTTIISFLLTIPFVLLYTPPDALMAAYVSVGDKEKFLLNTFICGMCFYLYNEMQNKVLGSLGPVTTAVGNTLKRVAIFVALYYFTVGETFPMPKIVGCGIAIIGCLTYAICNAKKW